MRKQHGFHAIELILIIVVVVALGGVIAWRLTTTTQPTATTPVQITTKGDIQKASQSLDDSSLDKSIDASSLEADINSVL